MKDDHFKLVKERRRRYTTQTIMDVDYTDGIPLLEWIAAGIGLHVYAHKMEYMCFNQWGDISTVNGSSLKLVDNFTYQGSSVSSTEKDISTLLAKAWTAFDRLLVIWKPNLTNKIKRNFFRATVVLIMLYGCTTWTLTKCMKKKLDDTYHPSQKLSKLDEPDMWDTAGEVKTNS